MSKINYLRILTLIQIFCCYMFLFHTKGLIYHENDNYFPVKLLKSSGSDDDAFAFYIGILSILFFIILIIKKWSSKILIFLSFTFLFFQTLCIFIIQMGDITITIIRENNYYLLYIILYPIAVVLILFADKIRNKFRFREL